MTLGDKTMRRVAVSIPTLCSEKKSVCFLLLLWLLSFYFNSSENSAHV